VLLGHFAVAAASKRVTPRAPLWALFLAAEWADVVWPVLVLAGVEHVRVEPGNTAMTPRGLLVQGHPDAVLDASSCERHRRSGVNKSDR
jgi:hypothetical protein